MWKEQLKKQLSREAYIERLIRNITGKSVFLFGAGVGGSRTGQILFERNIDNIIYVDNNKQKQGTLFCGKNVISPQALAELYKKENDIHVVITAGEGTSMMRQLISLGINEEDISIFDTSQISGCEDNYKYLMQHEEEITQVCSLLEDEYSKEVLVGLLNYRMTLDFQELKNIFEPDEDQYFAEDLVGFSKEDVFVDAGTYDGLTIKEYLKRCNGEYGKVICFEADKDNVMTIQANFKEWNVDKADIYPLGLWSKKDVLRFDAIGSGSGRISDAGTVSIDVDSLDCILRSEKVDFIKMDIEGAEIEALKGASEIIASQMPTLAISVYHNPEDIFAIPLLIHKMCPEYKLYLRHYRQYSAQETICYAIHRKLIK